MSQEPKFSADLHKLCGKLRDGDITQAESERLSEMMRESRGARRFYRTFMALASALEARSSVQDSVDQESDSDKSIEVLFDLLHMEQQAEVLKLSVEPLATDIQQSLTREETMNWHKVADASGYLLSKAAKAAKSAPAEWLASAAVILLAATLFFVFKGNHESPITQPPFANTPSEIDEPQALLPAVATLTATHNAQWAGWDLTPGTKLLAGQRLTLTAGFAEITTNRGAVVILEAPAIAETIDSPNALRLIVGKLVGICETESSKGLLVRTAHMDVTDLGTRFGIDTMEPDRAVVHVIDGEVEVAWQAEADAEIQREEVVAGQAMAADVAGVAQRVAYEPQHFVADFADAVLRPNFADSNVLWLGQLSGDLTQDKRDADALQIFLERQDLALPQDIAVDFSPNHVWDPQGPTGQQQVTAGERVDVYLLHFDLIDGHDKPEEILLDFGRPILGVIVSQAELDKTDAALGVEGVTYPVFVHDPAAFDSGPRGLNSRSVEDLKDFDLPEFKNDLATISPDGMQLNLRLWGGEANSGAKMDQVRVLVRSDRDFENRLQE